MVRVLIDLQRTIARRQLVGSHPAMMITTVVFAALAAVGTLLLGLAENGGPAGWADVVALSSLLWVGGRIAQSAMAGEPVLRPELFAVLPLPRRKLAASLMLIGLLDPANAFLLVALGSVVVKGASYGPAAAVIAAVALVLTVVLTSVCATLAAGLLGPGSARGRDLGTLVVAVAISLLAMTGTLLPSLLIALRQQSVGWLSQLLRVLPTGWGPSAVVAAGNGSVAGAVVLLVGLLTLIAIAGLAGPVVLGRRMSGRRPRHGRRGRARSRRLLSSNATAAVIAKELRLWVRDPMRLTCLVIALIVGTGACVVPQLTAGTDLLLPYGGSLAAVIAAACACNLYGNDGAAIWLTVTAPGSVTADVVGRQLSWLIVVAPYAIASTVVLTALSGQPANWPWALGLLAAVLGGGVGLAPLSSVISPQPLDAAGGPTPAFSLKVHVALIVAALTAAPTLLVLLAGGGWRAVPVGVLTGLVFAIGCGRLAIGRLNTHQVDILQAVIRTT
ncbi:hypothetical protein FOE78_03700 [Microlunatus elymi]|uniref:ABC-2 type transport system permease protein n=1 Tax=Microlunatus elymi TaxID=2596828 RepID=A0A516PVB7_9ACTN|nr:hypothetical protein [Microlunatus elymi]QDP95137.1 hypothetical protein FOE78_03700 [Microlunatus elymi]